MKEIEFDIGPGLFGVIVFVVIALLTGSCSCRGYGFDRDYLGGWLDGPRTTKTP